MYSDLQRCVTEYVLLGQSNRSAPLPHFLLSVFLQTTEAFDFSLLPIPSPWPPSDIIILFLLISTLLHVPAQAWLHIHPNKFSIFVSQLLAPIIIIF